MTRSVPVAIGRGENSGRSITYTNVVRRWIKLGDWTGKAETFNVPLKDVQTDGIDAVAVLVQSGASSAPKLMLGAAQIALQARRSSAVTTAHATRIAPVRARHARTEKRAGDEAGPRSVGGLNRTRNNRPGPFKPRGAGGLRNPVLSETGPEVSTVAIILVGLAVAWPKLGSIMISLTNP